ncbi:MAG TPA: NADH-quinone oxidoreductase subunit K [Syntrophomonadaceae bacterium]|nr:NADH-quinone oxidoreductase subunit K [Syntrophomonadaceae bacterium]
MVTSLCAVELRNLKWATLAYISQALLLVSILAAYAITIPNKHLLLWCGTVLITKAVIIPVLLMRYVKRVSVKEVTPGLGFGVSLLVGAALMALVYHLVHGHVAWFIPNRELGVEPYLTNLAVALTILVLGVFALITRRDVLKMVLSLCIIENAVHLSLVSLAPEIPETAMIGVVTDVVLAVWILLVIVKGINDTVGDKDVLKLSKLRG